MSGSSSVAVYRPACPVYQVTCTRDVAVLAGGGGAGNFGVPNVLAIVEANPSGIRTVSEYKTDKGAFNNAAIHAETNSIVGSIDGETLSFTLSSTDHSLSEPKTHTTDDRSKAEDRFQTAVSISPDGALIATATDNGAIAIWDAVSMKKLAAMNHKKRHVLCLGFNARGTSLLSAGMAQQACIWDITQIAASKGSQSTMMAIEAPASELSWSQGSAKPLVRCGAFGVIDGQECVYTVINGLPGDTTKMLPHLVKWSTSKETSELVQTARRAFKGTAQITCLATSANVQASSHFIALGDIEGCVRIVTGSNLQLLLTSKAHSQFVTSIAFAPSSFYKPLPADSKSESKGVQTTSTQTVKKQTTQDSDIPGSHLPVVLSTSAELLCMATPVPANHSARMPITQFSNGRVACYIMLILFCFLIVMLNFRLFA
eukprot:m.48650 g.48650  ORF g.48650 m.48650 type:complete len:429 (-) comp11052_c1_seq1:32-1318(-)